MFLVAVSVPLGWFAWEMQRAIPQREAVWAIVNLGGEVSYDYELGKYEVCGLLFTSDRASWIVGVARI
jgi:hypothetical protein